MRLAYLSASRLPSSTANSVHVMRMCQAFASEGVDVLLLAQGDPRADVSALYRHYDVRPTFEIRLIERPTASRGGPLAYIHGVRRALSGSRFDVVYARHLFALALLNDRSAARAFEFHAPPLSLAERAATRHVLRARQFKAAVAISETLANDLRAAYPGIGERLLVAHDGADLPQETPAPLARWPGREGRAQVGYVGSFYAGRGIELVVECARALPHVDFHLVGGNRDTGVCGSIVTLPQNLYFHGYLAQSSLPSIYAHLDILVAPYQRSVAIGKAGRDTSRWMSPLKLFEYMAYGKPIIASELPAIREILDETTAVLCSPSDPDAWAAAIQSLVEQPHTREILAERSRSLVISKFTWRSRAATILSHIKECSQ